ncbi:MAG: 50S ribosomal protein L11 methyltransferase [Brumimicrobium sp.]|nr:50S ribosomal protein L11 methyltransferase [Brumimicrobium sp.]
MDYIQINLDIKPFSPWAEILTQELADIGFDSFMEENGQLQAFIPKGDFNKRKLDELLHPYSRKEIEIHYETIEIPHQNWNATWEADYTPIKISNELLIRAPFHSQDNSFKISLEIQPQMSFGTGHHPTTYLLCQTLLEIDFKGKSVADIGTGTGILGILASKLGARNVFGNDIDDYAVENAIENCERNNIQNFKLKKGSIDVVPNEKFDVIIANINRNVLMQQMENYSRLCIEHGTLILSGFYEVDCISLMTEAEKNGFRASQIRTLDTWAILKLEKLI